MSPAVLPTPRGLVNLARGQQLNNNSDKSVSTSATKSKKSQRKSRQDSYREKFGNRPHMIIPQEDFTWALDKHNSVKTLFMECWLSDPYGSHWQDLKHSLKPSSFKRAKKIISDKGLFIFEPKKSIRDGRETTHWRVLNLHGARKNDYWLNVEKSSETSKDTVCNQEDHPRPLEDHPRPLEDHPRPLEGHPRPSISDQSLTQQAIPNPTGASQECLSNSPKELLETLVVDPWEDDCDRDTAFEGRVTSASSESEKSGQRDKYPEHKPELETDSSSCRTFSETDNTSPAVTHLSLKSYIEQVRKDHPHMSEEVVYAVAQKLAIEAEQTTEEYQRSSREASARIRAITEGLKEKKRRDRERRLRGDSY